RLENKVRLLTGLAPGIYVVYLSGHKPFRNTPANACVEFLPQRPPGAKRYQLHELTPRGKIERGVTGRGKLGQAHKVGSLRLELAPNPFYRALHVAGDIALPRPKIDAQDFHERIERRNCMDHSLHAGSVQYGLILASLSSEVPVNTTTLPKCTL